MGWWDASTSVVCRLLLPTASAGISNVAAYRTDRSSGATRRRCGQREKYGRSRHRVLHVGAYSYLV